MVWWEALGKEEGGSGIVASHFSKAAHFICQLAHLELLVAYKTMPHYKIQPQFSPLISYIIGVRV